MVYLSMKVLVTKLVLDNLLLNSVALRMGAGYPEFKDVEVCRQDRIGVPAV